MRRYNWTPDLPDFRDHHYTQPGEQLPDKVDLREYCSAVEDQGDLGACTSHALVGAMEMLEIKAGNALSTELSRLFIYYNERAIEGTIRSDAGANLRDGIKSLAKIGVCAEALWPYDTTKFRRKPNKKAVIDAAYHKITEYLRVERKISTMRECLADGFPFVFGFSVYKSFESDYVAKTGFVPMPTPHEKMLGGHAVLAVGYSATNDPIVGGAFLVRNSWGNDWGQTGYFWLPYAYFTNRGLTSDFWTIRK